MLIDQRQALSLALAQARYAVVGRLSQNQVSNSNRKRSHSASPETERLQTVRYRVSRYGKWTQLRVETDRNPGHTTLFR